MEGRSPPAPLIGRDADVAALLAAIGDARAGEPRCVVVTGEAGIGKTRLVAEALGALDDALLLTGRAADMTTGEIAFGVLADTLRDLLRQCGPEGLTPAEASALAPLLPGGSASDSVEPARIHSRALDLLGRLSTDRLLVWVVEDLHWADSATRDLVKLTARTVRGRLLLVVTVRTGDAARSRVEEVALDEQVASLVRVPHASRVDLHRLTPDQVRALARSLSDEVSTAGLHAISRLSDGIPFFVEELTAAHGRPEQSTAGAALAGRTARLTAPARRLVAAAAIGDGHLRISLVERVIDTGPEEFDAALVEAVDGGVLTCDPDSDQLGFRHALLRESVTGGIGPGARRAWHRRWAQVLEERSGVLASDPATLAIAEHWHHTGDVAMSVSAAFVAVPAARRMLDETRRMVLWQRILEGWDHRDPGSAVGQLTLRQAIGEALAGPITWGQPGEGVLDGFLRAASAQPLARPERVRLELFRAAMHATKNDYFDDLSVGLWADREVDWLAQPPDSLTLDALLHISRGLPPNESGRADLLLQRAEELIRESGDHERLVAALKVRANRLDMVGDVLAATRVYEETLSQFHVDEVRHRLAVTGDLAWAYVQEGRHGDADRLLARTLEETPHLEAVTLQWEHLVENAVYTWMCTGEWHRARDVMERSSPWWPDDLRLSNLWLARLDLVQHGVTSEDRWRDHLGVRIPRGPNEGAVRGLLAQAAGQRGDVAGMRELVGPVWTDGMVDDGTWLTAVDIARLEAAAAIEESGRRDRDVAAEHLHRMADGIAGLAHVGPHEQATPLEIAAQLERIHGRDPREALQAALAAWAAMDHVPDVAVTLVSLAEAHAEHGDRHAAREHLAEGRRIAADLGAGPLLDRATRVARHYGFTTRERRPAEVFTDREVEVLQLLAEGRTNKEIAETLFISPKTASVHVSRIIAKTGAGNRTEAVTNARRHGLLPDDT